MAIVWMDFPSGSQGLYGDQVARLTDGVYAEAGVVGLVEDPDPNVTGRALMATTNASSTRRLRKVLPTPQTTMGVAFRLWLPGLPGSNTVRPSFTFADDVNAGMASFTVDTIGRIQIRDGGADGTVVAETDAPVLTANAWTHVEVLFTQSVGAGTCQVRVEGVEVLNETGIATGINPYQQWIMASAFEVGSAYSWYIKDLVIYDGSGGWGDSFVGSVQVFDLRPTADVSTGWSRTTGTTDWEILDSTPPDDTQYIFAEEDPSIPAPSITEFADLPEDVTSVRAVMMIGRMRKSDGGDAQVQMSLLSGGEADDGADRAITTAFTYWWDISHLDPDTSSNWTPPGLDAATFQINRTL